MPSVDVVSPQHTSRWLRRFSKLTCYSTLFLIFVGGMVTSTGSGLAVPDWPLSYGTLFPPMIGGVFYEHGHRMVASLVGFFMLCLAIWLGFKEKRRWVRYLGFCALGAVIVQGLLGGITVLFFLPTPVSVAHGVLAQTFFILTILIAYSLCSERRQRETLEETVQPSFLRAVMIFVVLIYIQLIIGAIMRHTHSGLAIPDFPKMGGGWIPHFDDKMLAWINYWNFENNHEYVQMNQVLIHFLHRTGAVFILFAVCFLNIIGLKCYQHSKEIMRTVLGLDILIGLQIALGVSTVLTQKLPSITSLHVVTGAAILGLSTLLLLRTAPLKFHQFKKIIFR